ncbi:D-aminoacid aminotransferase-like PLP-dependent enzymes superfamily protein [Perilla frutescens var. frutescens]|nr:D-aminoacid aminotransferase-like PLP-dependent enzymes superfamily protein [Perilla frutescens var. frutescens]
MAAAAEGMVEVIHLWSSPRSVSTSLMYSFAQVQLRIALITDMTRDDMEVLDEPLYANLLRVAGTQRPYREELLSKMESDGNKVVKEIIFSPGPKKYRFCKHMASQHLPGLPDDLMKTGKHCILIRNPLDVLTSYDKVISPSLADLGYDSMVSIYSDLCSRGQAPLVIDSDLLREDPEATLRGLCDYVGIPFQAAMLKWESGPKPFDGLWAPYWYKSTHKSTGFEPPRKYPPPFPSSLYNLLEQSLPFYDLLKRYVRHTTPKSPEPHLPVTANKKLLAWVGDEIVSRENAKVSVFDSVVQGGDAAWEGLRIYDGKIFKLEEHLDRLFDSTKALAFSNLPTREYVKEAIFKTLIRNGMFNNAHIRLTLTRGKKVTSGMSPAFNLYGCSLIVLAEWKPPVYDNESGITLVTASTRRNSPNNLDSKIHHNNLLNNILAKIEGNNSHADDAIMLDKDGYVSETNATNIFLVKKGHVATPHADYCLPGITRGTVMELVVKEKMVLSERRISISEFHTADEVFTTGTMGELTPVTKIDGRVIGDGKVGPVTRSLQDAHRKLTAELGVPIPTYHQP